MGLRIFSENSAVPANPSIAGFSMRAKNGSSFIVGLRLNPTNQYLDDLEN
jgi:hypothetical protein